MISIQIVLSTKRTFSFPVVHIKTGIFLIFLIRKVFDFDYIWLLQLFSPGFCSKVGAPTPQLYKSKLILDFEPIIVNF
jgi:hypothetical protein